jgi:methylmalonyl-CoA mutase C-terminal domain/subunit
MKKKIRVLLSKMGLDGHDRGVKMLAQLVREAGMEVIYLGQGQTAEKIVRSAVQEDVDVVGISLLSGSHLVLMPVLFDALKKEGVEKDFLILLGGIIPDEDIPVLKEIGVDEVFQTGVLVEDIIDYIYRSISFKKQQINSGI